MTIQRTGSTMVLTLLIVLTTAHITAFSQNLPEIDVRDSSFEVYNGKFSDDMRTVFGYSKPDESSQRIICFGSGFSDEEATSCTLGGHYGTPGVITFVERLGEFVKLQLEMEDESIHDIYMRTADVKFVGTPKKSAKKQKKR